MRLFYALTFDRSTRTKLHQLATTLAPTPAMGRPVEGDQLHLTLLFLGEVDHEAAETLKADRLTIITDDEEGSEKSDFGNITIVPLWKWLLEA